MQGVSLVEGALFHFSIIFRALVKKFSEDIL